MTEPKKDPKKDERETKEHIDSSTQKSPSVAETSEMRMGNISIILDSYDDLFSDFDPRSYEVRTVSDDFLKECRRALSGKNVEEAELELRLLVPEQRREPGHEANIKRRLKGFFSKQWKEKRKEIDLIKKEGVLWAMAGFALMLIAAAVGEYPGFLFKIIFVIAEPAGWFSVWTGLDKLFFGTREKEKDLYFDRRMAEIKVNFYSYANA